MSLQHRRTPLPTLPLQLGLQPLHLMAQVLIEVPYLLSIETVGGSLVNARIRELPFVHVVADAGH